MFNRGEIWLANLNPPHGTEPGHRASARRDEKTRPVLVIQAQALLDAVHPSTYVIPLTTQLIDNAEPLRIRIPAGQDLSRDSDLLMDQLRAIDNRRLIRGPLLRLPRVTMRRVASALFELLDIET